MTNPSWDPAQYLRHADHRSRPFRDLLARVPELPGVSPRVGDLGCGPGNMTRLLVERWPAARVTGYDNSARMLAEAAEYAGEGLSFEEADLTTWTPGEEYDLLISNAALQWVPGHVERLPEWLSSLAAGGVFAFQVPYNLDAPHHTLMRELAAAPRWKRRLSGVLRGENSVQLPETYLRVLAEEGLVPDVWTTTYLHVLQGEDPVLDWVKGTGLRPALDALADDPEARDVFVDEYRGLLREAYPKEPYGTVFPFRRLFVVATKAG